MIPQSYIEELVQRNDMVDVAQSYVQLRRRGRTYTGLCPFHSEKTPSFVVYPETQSFYCFGCGAGGDVITFIKKINNVDYVEAVKTLAARAGMAMPEEDDKAGRLRSRIVSINKDAARFFVQCLQSEEGRAARRYWRETRGLSPAVITRFGLGYAPNSFHAVRNHLRGLGYTQEEMLASGLVKRSEKGSLYDVFRNRVMVPIFDLRGNVIAFGGRNMGPEKPKYINSPETVVYKKSRTLFALNVAKKSDVRRYILCEGYMDVISLHAAGFTTAVAGCGTALTPEQVKLLSEYADEVVLCYDSDEAGQKATARAIELFSASPVKTSVLNIPGAKDPDEFIQKYGPERFAQLVDGSAGALEYELEKRRAKYDLARPDGRVGYLKEAIDVLASSAVTATERDVYAGRLSEQTDVDKAAILTQLAAAVKAQGYRQRARKQKELLAEGNTGRVKVPYSQGGARALGVAFAQQQLLAAVLKKPEFCPRAAARCAPGQFLDEGLGQAYRLVLAAHDAGETADIASLAGHLPEETLALISRILAQNYDVGFTEQDVDMYLARIEGGQPGSAAAAHSTAQQIDSYRRELKEKKK